MEHFVQRHVQAAIAGLADDNRPRRERLHTALGHIQKLERRSLNAIEVRALYEAVMRHFHLQGPTESLSAYLDRLDEETIDGIERDVLQFGWTMLSVSGLSDDARPDERGEPGNP
ncbi:MAG: hypothetical protein ACF8PN_05805 [Phycisphaerales bacterium]